MRYLLGDRAYRAFECQYSSVVNTRLKRRLRRVECTDIQKSIPEEVMPAERWKDFGLAAAKMGRLCPTQAQVRLLALVCLLDPDGLGEDCRAEAWAALADAQNRYEVVACAQFGTYLISRTPTHFHLLSCPFPVDLCAALGSSARCTTTA